MFKDYLQLTKPGIIFGNLVTAACGFSLASKGHFSFPLFFAMLLGLALVIASACVWNNYIDRQMDEKMTRTKDRVLVRKAISVESASAFGLILGFFGIGLLSVTTTLLATALAACGFFIYVVVYSLSKYRTSQATLIGSIAGAVPPVVGYTAASGALDFAALILFSIVVLWQMPHFYAIAMYRLEDYSRASIPILPIIKGSFTAKVHMLLYLIAFSAACFLLYFYGYAGYSYLTVSMLLSISWLFLACTGFKKQTDDKLWARQMFIMSLVVIMSLAAVIMF